MQMLLYVKNKNASLHYLPLFYLVTVDEANRQGVQRSLPLGFFVVKKGFFAPVISVKSHRLL